MSQNFLHYLPHMMDILIAYLHKYTAWIAQKVFSYFKSIS